MERGTAAFPLLRQQASRSNSAYQGNLWRQVSWLAGHSHWTVFPGFPSDNRGPGSPLTVAGAAVASDHHTKVGSPTFPFVLSRGTAADIVTRTVHLRQASGNFAQHVAGNPSSDTALPIPTTTNKSEILLHADLDQTRRARQNATRAIDDVLIVEEILHREVEVGIGAVERVGRGEIEDGVGRDLAEHA